MLRMRAGFSWSMRGGCISHWRGLSQSFAPLADSGKAQQLPPEDRGQQDQPQRLLPPEGEDFLASTDIERLIRSDFKEVHGMGSRLFVMFPRCEGREGGLTVLMCAPLGGGTHATSLNYRHFFFYLLVLRTRRGARPPISSIPIVCVACKNTALHCRSLMPTRMGQLTRER